MSLIHTHITGGSLPRPAGKADAEQAVLLAAQEALDTNRVHLLTRHTDTHLLFLAAPSRELTDGVTTTPLAAALPGHPGHRGDGCYVVYDGADAAVAILRGDTLRVVVNSTDAIDAVLTAEELPVHDVSTAAPWRLETARGRAQRAGGVWAGRLQAVATVWALGASVAAAALFVAAGVRDTAAAQQAQQLQALTAQLQLAQPLAADLAALQQVSALAVQTGGWLERYRHDGKAVSYTLRLPQWVAKATVDALGPEVRTEHDRAAGNIVARLGPDQQARKAK